MKLVKILPIIVIALLAASQSLSYAETEPNNDNLNLDSAFQAYAKEFESHNCRNRPENLKLKAAKDSLEQAIFPVLLTDKNISGCGFDHDVSSCKVLLKDDKIQLNVLSEEKNVKTTVNIANGIATVQEKFTSLYTVKYNFNDIDLKNLEDELYCQCDRWLIFNHSYCGQRSDEN